MLMKKIIAVLLVLFSAFGLFLTGCGVAQYTSRVVTSSGDKFSLVPEIDFWTGTSHQKILAFDKTCVVRGQPYTGSYKNSVNYARHSFTTDNYSTENYISFGLRSDTGELVHITLKNSEFYDTEPFLPDVSDPKENAISLATEIASEYVDHINEYTVFEEEPIIRYKKKDGVTYEITYYVINFVKMIDGYLSSDSISVEITSKGHLASLVIGEVGAFDDQKIDIDATLLNQSISDKIEADYKAKDFTVTKCDADEQRIVLTPDGYISVFSVLTLEGVDSYGEKNITDVCMVTYLQKK